MNKTFLYKLILISSTMGIVSCSAPAPLVPFGIDNSSIQLGKDQAGAFVRSSDKTFTSQDKILLKVKAKGLTITQGKIKANIDLFLKKDKDVLGTENDILGPNGLTQTVPGVAQTFSGANGEADLQITIIPPSNTKGEIVANVTLKDLNSPGKLSTFETKFTLK